MPRKVLETAAEAEMVTTPADDAAVPRKRRAPRKRVLEEGSNESAVVSVEAEKRPVRRKAPVRRVAAALPADQGVAAVVSEADNGGRRSSRPQRSRGIVIVSGVLLVIGVGVSAALGFSDKGMIDVTARMNEQLQVQADISGQSGDANYTLPVQNTQVVDVPNGGLRGRGIGSSPTPPPAPPEASVSTTSDAVATTTDAVTPTTPEDTGSEGAEESQSEDASSEVSAAL